MVATSCKFCEKKTTRHFYISRGKIKRKIRENIRPFFACLLRNTGQLLEMYEGDLVSVLDLLNISFQVLLLYPDTDQTFFTVLI
jgi:hypothetical protein